MGPNGTRVVAAEPAWEEPLKWNRKAKEAGERHRVFCASLADVFEDWQGPVVNSRGKEMWVSPSTGGWVDSDFKYMRALLTMQGVRERLFRLIDQTPHLDWLLLTKRPENVLKMTHEVWCPRVPGHVSQNDGDGHRWEFPPNVWLGTSVENQQAADERIPHLLRVPAAVRFLSCEPLLGPVELTRVHGKAEGHFSGLTGRLDVYKGVRAHPWGVDWVIVGGESGPSARPMHPAWARSLRDQCQAESMAFFMKQMGGVRDKGGDLADIPDDLRVRQFPQEG